MSPVCPPCIYFKLSKLYLRYLAELWMRSEANKLNNAFCFDKQVYLLSAVLSHEKHLIYTGVYDARAWPSAIYQLKIFRQFNHLSCFVPAVYTARGISHFPELLENSEFPLPLGNNGISRSYDCWRQASLTLGISRTGLDERARRANDNFWTSIRKLTNFSLDRARVRDVGVMSRNSLLANIIFHPLPTLENRSSPSKHISISFASSHANSYSQSRERLSCKNSRRNTLLSITHIHIHM